MYDVTVDAPMANVGGKDIPCNTHAYFWIDSFGLNITVCCRSNDVIWGAYGANAVHFSILQEYIAARLGVSIGRYYQISNDFHIYEKHFYLLASIEELCNTMNWYYHRPTSAMICKNNVKIFDEHLIDFMNNPEEDLNNQGSMITEVAEPMYKAFMSRKRGEDPKLHLDRIQQWDWEMACTTWVERRYKDE
jgi:thymidylate synthase